MSFVNADDMLVRSFVVFESENKDILNRLNKMIVEASDQGDVNVKLSFYKPENKELSKENRNTLVSYLRNKGFIADYINNEINIFWGVKN